MTETEVKEEAVIEKPAPKPDVVLANGREIFFDLSKATYGQVLGMGNPKEQEERSDHTLARLAGLTFDELKKCSSLDYKRIGKAFWKKWVSPLTDPNA